MKFGNPLAAALVITAATVLIVSYALRQPDSALLVIIVYITTIIFLSIIVYFISKIYSKHKSSVDPEDFIEICEDLNTEIAIWSDDFSLIIMNKKLRDLIGIDYEKYDKKEALFTAFGLKKENGEDIQQFIKSPSYESSFKNPNGTVSIAWSTSPVKKRKKRSVFLSTGFNLTEVKKMKNNLASANDFFKSSMELAEIGLLMSSDKKKFVASPEAVKMLGIKNSTIDISVLRSMIHPNDRIHFERAVKYVDASGSVNSIEMQIKSSGGSSYRWYNFRYKSIKGTANTASLFGGALIDVTQEHEKDILIERLAYIDEVTEIANRNKLMATGQELYDTCNVLGHSYWIIVLDIDRFHIVNDTCGYENGNYILKNFAHILYKFVTPGGIAARISGDNFALILKDYGDDDLPSRTARSIQEEFAKLAVDDFEAITLSCSAGFSKMPSDGNSFLDVMEHAEFALKSANGSQSTIIGYEPSMHDSIIGRNELEKALALAIDNNELQLFYQPKIDLRTGKIMGVEALIRWIKPDGTVIKPDSFVPVAESSHLIGKISEFVLNEGCRQNKLWQKMGYPNIVMSINFTSTDFYQADLKEKVLEALAKSKLDAKWLEVELTETLALSDIDFAVSQMNKLRELGVKLAMDDFGTGYSSLSYLQILPITLLKLDRSFITDIQHDNIAFEIVSAVIRIAKSKKIETIAEGIENKEQEEILRQAQCDYGQGYLYGKPMPAEKMNEFFEENAKITANISDNPN
ncbi:MAG: EAL domain-containing protein [Ruminococcus sp.]|nr:EAL domain-containing protein [Ruminococcus sp.]